ncbi:hypothetical protein SPLC1_S171160 [Arthrospira platensis C1]|nr:hypothetical protein SPLC1_S171160 [Arthrospira platensis C1]
MVCGWGGWVSGIWEVLLKISIPPLCTKRDRKSQGITAEKV